jgi:hypothetical protein
MPSLLAVKLPEPQFKHFLLVAKRSPMRFQTVLKDQQGYYLNPECLCTRTGEPVPRIPASRDFANDFRDSFASRRHTWPNVCVDYGPLTLMQGWIEVDPNSLEKDLLLLMERFERLSPLIDRLLESRRR